MAWYGEIQCGHLWFDVVSQSDAVWCGGFPCSELWYDVVCCRVVQCDVKNHCAIAIWCVAKWCTVHYDAVQCGVV
jgi:hypothetical protein